MGTVMAIATSQTAQVHAQTTTLSRSRQGHAAGPAPETK